MRRWRKIFAVAAIVAMTAGSSVLFVQTARGNTGDGYLLTHHAILYPQIAGKLRELQAKNPEIMRIDTIGQSSQGHDLFLVTITDKAGMKKLDLYQKFMAGAVRDPEAAILEIGRGADTKIPVFINASIHGNEITGTDGALLLIDKLLSSPDDPQVQKVLENTIVLINVDQNPDGRISGHRENANGFDLNRDYITQTQPEVRAVVANVATRWYPGVVVDLHGFMESDPVLIEPCTPPHNPNYEYDLFSKYALAEGHAMAKEVASNTGLPVNIPAEVWKDGWDDYPPIFAPQYFMYFGALCHTVEVKYPGDEGARTAMWASWGALKYAAQNKDALLKNQFEVFRRGVEGLNVEKDIAFPYAYVIPLEEGLQRDPLQAAKMIERLLFNKIEVKQAAQEFIAGGRKYPAGSYVVPMQQALRGLANTMLWSGEDISRTAAAMYDISAYSAPKLGGFDAIPIKDAFAAELNPVDSAPALTGSIREGEGGTYAFAADNNDSITAANALVRAGYTVSRIREAFKNFPPGTFLVKDKAGLKEELTELAAKYDVHFVGIGDAGVSALPVKLLKTAVVGDNGGAYAAMKEMGFDVTYVPYFKLNEGFDLGEAGFDALVIAGTQGGIWEGETNSDGMAWSLDRRGREEVLKFVKDEGHDFIGVGYAGAELNKEAGRLDVDFAYTGTGDGLQSAENGICTVDFAASDPLTWSYGNGGTGAETVFAYAPVWFTQVRGNGTVAAGFPKANFYQAGFWKEPMKAAGMPVIVHDNSPRYDEVLFGLDPTFRSYTPGTYRLMANALYYLGYDLGNEGIRIMRGGQELPVAPFISKTGVLYLPSRDLAAVLRAHIRWDSAAKKVILQKNGVSVRYPLGGQVATRNGVRFNLTAPVINASDSSYVPLAPVAKAFGDKFTWNAETKTGVIQ